MAGPSERKEAGLRSSIQGLGRNRSVVAAWACGLVLLAGGAGAEGRIVAVGDVHGEYQGFLDILEATGLVDEKGDWVGGKAVLVQTGDFTDRGAHVREVMDLLRKLEGQAEAAGGRVVVLLGNHEVMNLLDSFRDFSPAAYAAFADARSEERRSEAWEALEAHRGETGSGAGPEGTPPPESREEWMARHPPGRLEYQEAISEGGEYGRWMRRLPVVVELGGVAFMHAGVDPALELGKLDDINERVERELKSYVRAKERLVRSGVVLPSFDLPAVEKAVVREVQRIIAAGTSFDAPRSEDRGLRGALITLGGMPEWWCFLPQGPLWFRGYADWTEAEGNGHIARLKHRLGIERFVVAHTVLEPPGRVRTRFGGQVVLIDTGMLRERYGGEPSAVEVAGDVVTAFYLDDREVLLEAAALP
jgi:hypothetical protein